MMDLTSMGFPFAIDDLGQVGSATGDANIRAKILQVVLTAPGERVGMPEFGCGLRDLVFDPNNEILAATTEFAITKALQRWMSDAIVVQSVDIQNSDSALQILVTYVRRDSLEPAQVKITF
jgi:phage baseplate assembly protein W